MFRRQVKSIDELLNRTLRQEGLETPLLQKRLMDSWAEVVGEFVANYTESMYIRNQTLYVHLTNPAMRADLSMMRREIVNKLNAHVGTQVIADVRFN